MTKLTDLSNAFDWFDDNRPDLHREHRVHGTQAASASRRLLAIVDGDRLVRILQRVLDENDS